MKYSVFAYLIVLLIPFESCRKTECHRIINIINSTSDTVILAQKGYENVSGTTLCKLDGSEFYPGETWELKRRDCWEDILAGGKTWEIFIVDPKHFNPPFIVYDCDSIEIKNTVLKHYLITLDDIKKQNFTISYP
ncbi:MAG: hypothetical protein NTU98_06315 [Bacteroidetes bacterium]|nr:hypothetical protein [Bacteroidota bacterium]